MNYNAEPPDACYTILQDHGPIDGGWGPAAILVPPFLDRPTPFIYTGNAEHVLEVVAAACREMARRTGKPTRLVRFSNREDVAVFGGSS